MTALPYPNRLDMQLPVVTNVRLGTNYPGGAGYVPGTPPDIFSITVDGRACSCYSLYYEVDGRDERCAVFVPYGPVANKSKVIMGWPGSDGTYTGTPPNQTYISNGMMTMIKPYDVPPQSANVNTWFRKLVKEKDCVGLAVDLPAFGYNPFPGNNVSDSREALMKDLGAYLAYKYATENPSIIGATWSWTTGWSVGILPPKELFLCGYSWGAIRAAHTASVLSLVDSKIAIRGVYHASGHLDKLIDTREEFDPAAWPSDFNYADMARSTPAHKMRYAFGGASDYTYVTSPPLTPSINTILNDLIASDPNKFSRHDHGGGHTPDYNNIKSFCDSVI